MVSESVAKHSAPHGVAVPPDPIVSVRGTPPTSRADETFGCLRPVATKANVHDGPVCTINPYENSLESTATARDGDVTMLTDPTSDLAAAYFAPIQPNASRIWVRACSSASGSFAGFLPPA